MQSWAHPRKCGDGSLFVCKSMIALFPQISLPETGLSLIREICCYRQVKQSICIWTSFQPAAAPARQRLTQWRLTWRQASASGAGAASRPPSPKRSAGARLTTSSLQSSSPGAPPACFPCYLCTCSICCHCGVRSTSMLAGAPSAHDLFESQWSQINSVQTIKHVQTMNCSSSHG